MRRTILFSLHLTTEFMLIGLAFAADVPVPTPKPAQISKPNAVAVPPPLATLETSKLGPSACRSALHALGVTFKPASPVSDPIGCAIADPVEVTGLGPNITLAPAALLDCPTASKIATFIRDDAQNITIATLGSTIASITQASAYVCRTRHGATKLSEHAYGRALDIASFALTDKRIILVQVAPASEPKTKLFLDLIRAKACGPFTTVLGPGSDPDHALHFHFDLAPRKGRAFCQ
jgi:hypothetical protein